ncbi:MAG: TPM domain-containing protein [Ramlibacter sp.]
MTHGRVNRAFAPATLRAIEQAIKESESAHLGEVRFVVEGALDGAPLFEGQSARERALHLFSLLRIWDTEHNNGVLIYVLLADRAVEIVSDRGIHAKAGPGAWVTICHEMEAAFKTANFEQGAVRGVDAVTRQVIGHFPARRHSSNELPDRPLVL